MNSESTITEQKIALTKSFPLNKSRQLNEWIYERIAPFASGNILEIGSGSGDLSSVLIENNIPITLSDQNIQHCEFLRAKYYDKPQVNKILQIDLVNRHFEEIYCELLGSFDTIFSLNTMEHTSHDRSAVANAKKLLAPDGHLMLLIPAFAALYRGLDQGFNHWHRCNFQYIKKLLTDDFKIIKIRYFRLVGIVRFFLSASVVENNFPDTKQQSNYNKVVPTFCVEDFAFMKKGLLVIIVAQKI